MKLGLFHTAKIRVRASCLTLWLLFVWIFPVVLSATNTQEESGHACCRRSKHSCCKKPGKGASISGRSCGMSCPGLGKFQTGPAPALQAQTTQSTPHIEEPAARPAEAPARSSSILTFTLYQRPPPAA